MTVQDLITLLKDMPLNATVIFNDALGANDPRIQISVQVDQRHKDPIVVRIVGF